MWANFGCKVERQFHLIECPLKIGHWNGLDDGQALIAFDVGKITSDDSDETPATIRGTELRVGQKRFYDLVVHAPSLPVPLPNLSQQSPERAELLNCRWLRELRSF